VGNKLFATGNEFYKEKKNSTLVFTINNGLDLRNASCDPTEYVYPLL